MESELSWRLKTVDHIIGGLVCGTGQRVSSRMKTYLAKLWLCCSLISISFIVAGSTIVQISLKYQHYSTEKFGGEKLELAPCTLDFPLIQATHVCSEAPYWENDQ
jgi:hypothetical protein